jgi:hypothetical protein
MVTALGGVSVERALEQIQGVVDVTFNLFLMALEAFGLLVFHNGWRFDRYAYTYLLQGGKANQSSGERCH